MISLFNRGCPAWLPCFIFTVFCTFSFAQNQNLQQADFYYAKRAENSKDNFAKEKNITEAIKFYKLAIQDANVREEAAWKLLRAYYFKGCFTAPDPKERYKIFEKAKNEGKSFFHEFPNNPEVSYWYSVDLALWANSVNPFTALNAGAVKESRGIAQMLIATEKKGDSISAARGYQILGRAHQKIPRIAFVLNWINRDSSEVYLKKSLSLNSGDLATHLFLAEYYKDKKDKDTAEKLLLPFLKKYPRPEEYLEDERNYIKMRKLLE
ncbi:MAG: hypothetical protein LBB36_01510 [Fibromonadaceae bacterium]|jgi:tetratricopeptide (TPR) repeat protein|nr:hypothetical protein [Fibromonadaceae bacterium]